MTDWSEREQAAATPDAALLAEVLRLREEVELLRTLVRVMRGAMDAVEMEP